MTSPVPVGSPARLDRVELDWLARIRTGDHAAFEAFFRRYGEPLSAFAYTYLESQDAAQEIVQDVFCWIWEHRFTLDPPRSVRAYLYSAVRNRAINHLRDRRADAAFQRRAIERADGLGHSVEPARADDATYANELAQALARELAAMPTRCREVFTLARDQHLQYAEIAVILGISRKTVEIHMSRALTILRERLAPWLSG